MLAVLVFLQAAQPATADDLVSQIVNAVADHKWGALLGAVVMIAVAVGRALMVRKAKAAADAAGAAAVDAKPAGGASDIVGLKK